MRRFTRADFEPVTLERGKVRIRVLPKMGANLVSLQVDGREFIHFDAENLLGDDPHMTGCFQMFPTPCRLTACRYTFGGKEIVQRKRGEEVFIHGLVRDEEFSVRASGDALVASLEWGEGHPVYEGFPWPGKLETRFRLLHRGVEITFAFENRGDSPAPAGYGLHPFWAIPGDRAQTFVKIPTEFRLDLAPPDGQIPTGKLLPVSGTKYDLREWRTLADLFIDDVFFPKPPGAEAGVGFREEKIRMKITAADHLRHLICYSPQGQPYVCVENLTASPDAPNLYAKGFKDESGLAIIEPGKKLEGWVKYEVEGF